MVLSPYRKTQQEDEYFIHCDAKHHPDFVHDERFAFENRINASYLTLLSSLCIRAIY